MVKKILLVFVHPDDETYGTGGTIAKYASKGVEIHLITATDGGGRLIHGSHKIVDNSETGHYPVLSSWSPIFLLYSQN